jgi:hypothetical protein
MPVPARHTIGAVKNSSIISMHWQKIGRSGSKPHEIAILEGLVPAEGFEPPTTRLRSGCSTAELRRLKPRH